MNATPTEDSEQEVKTSTLSQRVIEKKTFDPGRFFAGREQLARSCLRVTLASICCSLCCALALVWSLSRPMVFTVLDPSGNVYVVRGSSFANARALHVEQALLATTALLSRNPKGFDLPEVIDSLFMRNAQNQALALKSAESAEFLDKHIQQKPQIFKIDALETRPDGIRVLVSGELIRGGVFHEEAIYETLPFTLVLNFRLNQDLLKNRRQPTLLNSFELKYAKTN
jgi:hypothetical protein